MSDNPQLHDPTKMKAAGLMTPDEYRTKFTTIEATKAAYMTMLHGLTGAALALYVQRATIGGLIRHYKFQVNHGGKGVLVKEVFRLSDSAAGEWERLYDFLGCGAKSG